MHLINTTAHWICEKLYDIVNETQDQETTPSTVVNATSIAGEGMSNASETTNAMIVIGCIAYIAVIGCCLCKNSRSGAFWARQEGRY